MMKEAEKYCYDCIHNEVCRYCPQEYCDFKEKSDGWISVDDRLPESDGFYLAWYTFKDSRHALDIFYFNAGSPISNAITHWQPLPEPPKEDKDG